MVHFGRYLLRQDMKASLFYRIAAVLLLFFAVAHTLGFRQSDPNWGVDPLLGSIACAPARLVNPTALSFPAVPAPLLAAGRQS